MKDFFAPEAIIIKLDRLPDIITDSQTGGTDENGEVSTPWDFD